MKRQRIYFPNHPSLMQLKRSYRVIAGNLAEYYSYKIEDAKGADRDKFAALEKKWDDLFTKLNDLIRVEIKPPSNGRFILNNII